MLTMYAMYRGSMKGGEIPRDPLPPPQGAILKSQEFTMYGYAGNVLPAAQVHQEIIDAGGYLPVSYYVKEIIIAFEISDGTNWLSKNTYVQWQFFPDANFDEDVDFYRYDDTLNTSIAFSGSPLTLAQHVSVGRRGRSFPVRLPSAANTMLLLKQKVNYYVEPNSLPTVVIDFSAPGGNWNNTTDLVRMYVFVRCIVP